MGKPILLLLLCLSSGLLQARIDSAAKIDSETKLAEFSRNTALWFAIESNLLPDAATFSGSINLHNDSAVALPAGEGNWAIYFHLIRKIEATEHAGLRLTHVQGDLHRISATVNFAGLAPGQQLTLPFQSAPWIISYSDFMPRAFIVVDGLPPAVFANTDTEQLQQFVRPLVRPEQLLRNIADGDKIPPVTAEQRYYQSENRHSENRRAESQQSQPLTTTPKVETTPGTSNLQQRLIPKVQQLESFGGELRLDSRWQIRADAAVQSEARYLQQQLQQLYGLKLSLTDSKDPSANSIALTLADKVSTPESYLLKIRDAQVNISGADAAGVFYGIQSLLALLPLPELTQNAPALTLPTLQISDAPRYRWRGMHYDMARNFHGLDATLRLIEQMGRYKLNKLHLHLTEDEGWRLQIPGLEELTSVGAFRCFDLSEQDCLLTQLGTGPAKTGSGNGYYSRADFVRLLQHAKAHHIEVIPEIDLPGHARAAIKAMEARYQRLMRAGKPEQALAYRLTEDNDASRYLTVQNYNDNAVNVCLESSYRFIDKVISELQLMYQDAGIELRIFHMGGDEVAKGAWEQAPSCLALIDNDPQLNSVADLKPYFINRVAQLTAARGLKLAAWEDGLMADPEQPFARDQFQNEQVLVNAWDNIWEWGYGDRAYKFANAGYLVVQSAGTNLYFDHPQEAHPEERGYYWATRYTDTEKVFFYRPDHLYHNAEFTRDGSPINDLAALLGRPLPELTQPQNMLGIQGQVWSETIRTAEQLEQMIYPRLIALAERAWHRAPWEPDRQTATAQQDLQQFLSRLTQVELKRLQQAGNQHYLPAPGAKLSEGLWQLNHRWPEVMLEFSLDGGQSWQPYVKPLPATAGLLVRGRFGQVTSRVERLQP